MSDLDSLKSPCGVVDLNIVKKNCQNMLDLVAECTVDFRPHVKTHKTIEGVLLQLGGVYRKIVTSTLSECYFYAKCNQIDDIIYGIPITPDKFPDCLSLHQQVQKFHIMIDNDWVLEEIENFCSKNNIVFNVFILLDTGYARAGIVENEEGYNLVKRVNSSKYTNFSGIYTHAGHSYGCTEKSNIIEVSDTEITVAIRFANHLKENMSIDCPEISVGSTPSSTVTREIQQLFQSNPYFASKINIHPGNYIFYDRMQATINSDIVKAPNMCAFRVLARVISKSIVNNSFCIDAGALSLSKDLCTNPSITGYGKIITLDSEEPMNDNNWNISRVSQEISVVTNVPKEDLNKLKIGQPLLIIPNHSCLSSACFNEYYIFDNEKLVEKWIPCKFWY